MNMMPAIYLDKLVEAQDANSETFGADMIDYISAMQSETLSLVIPIVHLEMNGENVVHVIDSMAVFKGDQMVGELDATQTRGLLWVKGRVSSGVINVDIDDGLASLEILNATSKVEPMVSDDGKVTMRISISTDLRLTEQTCTENLAPDENLLRLQELAKKAIQQKIEQVFEQAKTLHADVFGFGELIHKHHNDIWTNMEPNWDEIFQTITLDIEIEPTIKAVGSIEEPAWDRGGLEP
jgi:spore germination protein KC